MARPPVTLPSEAPATPAPLGPSPAALGGDAPPALPPLTSPAGDSRAAEIAEPRLDLAAALRPAWVAVDLDALDHNLAQLRHLLGDTRTLAVVKADAYGHGAPAVARALEKAGVDWLGVALLEEGAEIRHAGVELPILVLGTARPAMFPFYRQYRLVPTVSSLSDLALWGDWVEAGSEPQPIHLKVDTGMGRLGIALDEVGEALALVRRRPLLRLAGVLSHFAAADDLASPRNRLQEERFGAVLALLTEDERAAVEVHMANSAAALYRPDSRFTLVRLGIALYGLDPAQRPLAPAAARETPENSSAAKSVAEGAAAGLRPVMSVAARIVQMREVPAGTPLSYGGRMVTARRSEIAVVPVGYADGYDWRLGGRASALVRGRRVPIAGSVTMDMTLFDVTGTGAGEGDEVVLLGSQGGESVSAGELARHAGTIPWEILCHLGLRLPRRYVRAGRVEELVSRFSRGDA